MAFGVFHLFCGMGGGALGFQRAEEEYLGFRGRYRTLGGVDVDPEACQDFTRLTGVPATCLDLFGRADYTAFHGHEPPAGWREATPADLRAAAGGEPPDVIFLSPPCKGFSGLLPRQSAQSAKYAALNRLTLRGVWLALEAWADDPPGLILLENVPRITTRGAGFLLDIRRLLTTYGYRLHEASHDLGELGGLAQHRRRYLLVARHPAKVGAVLYQPPTRRVRAVGEILGTLPLPDDSAGGPLHRLPRLTWLTWLRLALVPAGGDWRELQRCDPATIGIVPEADQYHHTYRVTARTAPAGTVTGAGAPSNGATCVADPRLDYQPRDGAFRVQAWTEPGTTVVAHARPGGSNGVAAVADPRLPGDHWRGLFRIVRWDEPSRTVTGQATAYGSNGAMAVADPRLGCAPRNGAYRVVAWTGPAPTVTGAGDVHAQGAAAVADPRLPAATDQGVWCIVAEDGTWHRPLTTLELAALQGLPTTLPDGSPLVLAGRSQARWRERIGNAVPPPAAEAIGRATLLALIPSRLGVWAWNVMLTSVWVRMLVERMRMAAAGPMREGG